MLRRPTTLLLSAAVALSGLPLLAGLAGAAEPVRLLAGSTPESTPFPSNAFTVADDAQQTGLRIALPTAGCDARGRSLCDDLALINQLDGFDLQPRVTLPFSGPVDLLSVTPQTVFLETPTGARAGGLTQLVFDPASNTVAGITDAFLAQKTTYTLVVTSGVKGLDGTPVDVGGSVRRTPFTTMTSANTLERARAGLDDGTAYTAAGIPADGRAVDFSRTFPGRDGRFTSPQATTITRNDQRSTAPGAPLTSSTVINTAASATHLGFGSILSPQYVDGQGVIASTPTGAPLPAPTATRIGVTMMTGAPGPQCLQPVVFGPGFTRSKYDLFLSGDALPGRRTAVFATDPLGHAYGPASTVTVASGAGPATTSVTGTGFGRGKDLNGDGVIAADEGVGPTFTVRREGEAFVPDQPSPVALVGLRDGLIQTVVDNMALVRALEKGVDVDGNGSIDTCTGEGVVAYYGQSFGGIYGTMLLGSDPRVRRGALNVPGGPIVDIARESGFRDRISAQLAANKPDLRNGGPGRNGFTESMPLRLDPRVTDPVPGAIAIQEYGARGNWIERPGNPETYAPRIKALGKQALYQIAYTDGTVPNPTSGVLLRAGDLYGNAWIYRNDRTPTVNTNPHGFLLDPTVAGRNQGQQQVADFVTLGTVTDPDGPGPEWESPSQATVSTDYRVQLDCLHYPDPQTGQAQSRTPNSPDCVDRSGTVTRAQVAAAPAPSASAPAGASPSPSSTNPPGFPHSPPGPSASPSASASAAAPSASPSTTPPAAVSPSASPSSPAASSSPAAAGQPYVALGSPQRALDSRSGLGTAPGRKSGPVRLDLSGVLPAGAQAAVLNVTVLNASRRGFVVVHPSDRSQPPTSNVNVEAAVPGQRANTQANQVVVRLAADRSATVVVSSTTADVVVDVVGWFGPAGATGERLAPVPPQRLFDTRTTDVPQRRGEVVLDLTGTPAEGASSVVLNVTATRPSARGFVVAFPTGTSRPSTSNVNVEQGQTQANEVVSRVGSGNRVSLFVDSTEAALVVDLVGVVRPTVREGFVALDQPLRAADTRTGQGLPSGRVTGTVRLRLSDVPASATAVVLNVTATNGTRPGFVGVHPGGSTAPGTSNVNFPTSLTQANEVLTALGPDRDVSFTVGGSGAPAAHLVVDVVGYLTS